MSTNQPALTQPAPTHLQQEMKIIPAWAWGLAGIAFISMQIVFNFVIPNTKGNANPPPAAVCVLLGFLAGAAIGVYFLLLGYVNVDAGRRGMSRLLWTLIAIFVPNALGFILYFLMRQPAMQPCPQCHTLVQATFNYCPTCNAKLHPHCAQCQRMVRLTDTFCPYCGYKLADINH